MKSNVLVKQDETPVEFNVKVTKLCHFMKSTLLIFSELFSQTKNIKKIVQRLHGWEDEFEDFLFEDGKVCLKNINMLSLIGKFGLNHKTSRSSSYYNKLKLLTE